MDDKKSPRSAGVSDESALVSEQVGLAVRQLRRELGMSQRAYAESTGRSKSAVARLESAAGGLRLHDVVTALAEGGFRLVVLRQSPEEQEDEETTAMIPGWSLPEWELTDLLARTRGDERRFPAHVPVRETVMGPGWWWADEMMRPRRKLGPQPRWTAEGARVRPGFRARDRFEYRMRAPIEDP